MVPCKSCHTPNSLDSTFCKKCGTSISAEDLKEATVKLDKLVEEGNTLFNAGRTDEALAIAESAVLANPSSSAALSLKALCHERRGEFAEALDCADKLVELNPDSEFDKIRRSTLRQKLQSDLRVPPGPDKGLAIMAAVASVVLVICIGVLLAKLKNSNDGERLASNGNETFVTGTQPNLSGTSNTVTKTPTDNSNPQTTSGGSTEPSGAPAKETTPTPAAGKPSPEPKTDESKPIDPNATDTLPKPDNNGGFVVTPVHPPTTDVSTNPVATPKKAEGEEPTRRTTSTDPAPITNPVDPSPAPTEDPGQVQITVHPASVRNTGTRPRGGTSGQTGGGGSTSSNPEESRIGGNGLQALIRVGSQQFQLGNYAGAAKSYDQAVRNGGDPIILNRRLAQAYERIGRNSDAVEAYRRCIAAIDSELNSGRGNRTRLSSTRDLCLQAIKVLGG